MDLPAIRADLADALSAVEGLNVISTKPGTVFAPAAILGAYRFDPHTVAGGGAVVTWTILVVVTDSASGSMDDLDTFMSDNYLSVVSALEGFQSANWSSLQVQPTEDVQVIDIGATSYIGCRFPVEIFC